MIFIFSVFNYVRLISIYYAIASKSILINPRITLYTFSLFTISNTWAVLIFTYVLTIICMEGEEFYWCFKFVSLRIPTRRQAPHNPTSTFRWLTAGWTFPLSVICQRACRTISLRLSLRSRQTLFANAATNAATPLMTNGYRSFVTSA